MTPQTFTPGDLGVVAFLVLLEGLLSADNALVLAMMVRHLSKPEQKKALLYGLGGSFVFRLIAILLAGFVIRLWWLQAAGALYLLYLPLKHFLTANRSNDAKPVGKALWPTIVAVEIADVAFAVDSVLAGVALVKDQSKLWVVYVGAIIGVVLLRFAAAVFIRLLDRYPVLDHVAYLLVAWVGVKLSLLSVHNGQTALQGHAAVQPMSPYLFWGVLAAVVVFGALVAVRNPKATLDETLDDCFEDETSPPGDSS